MPANGKWPCNMEAEQAVLHCMLRRNECIPEVRAVLGGSFVFFDQAHAMLYSMILKVHKTGPVDLVLLGDAVGTAGKTKELRGGLAYLAELWDCRCNGNAVSYAAIVRDKYFRRRAIRLASDFLRNVETGRPINELLFSLAEHARNLWNESRPSKGEV